MALSDDLAYTSVADLARLIRERQVSPVEVMDTTIERIEARNAGLNAVVYKGYEEARARALSATDAVMTGTTLGPLHGVPTLMKDLFDFKPGWTSTFGGIKALATTVIDATCVFVERVERDGAIVVGQDQQPGHGVPRDVRQPALRAVAPAVRHVAQRRWLVGWERRGGRRWARRLRGRDRCGRVHPDPSGLVRTVWPEAVVGTGPGRHPTERVRGHGPVRRRRPDHADGRGRRARPADARRRRRARSVQPVRPAARRHDRARRRPARCPDRLQPRPGRLRRGSAGGGRRGRGGPCLRGCRGRRR